MSPASPTGTTTAIGETPQSTPGYPEVDAACYSAAGAVGSSSATQSSSSARNVCHTA